jgi:hypothetical protein
MVTPASEMALMVARPRLRRCPLRRVLTLRKSLLDVRLHAWQMPGGGKPPLMPFAK